MVILPAQIQYLVENITNKKISVWNRQSFYNQLKEISEEISKVLRAYDTEYAKVSSVRGEDKKK